MRIYPCWMKSFVSVGEFGDIPEEYERLVRQLDSHETLTIA